MARIRTIKPEFWTAEQVMELSRDARLLFVGMWNFCDDAGVHPAALKTLKAEVFPGDDITSAEIQTMVDEIIAQGLLIEFEHEGRRWWHVTGWKHQLINRPTPSRYPKPPRNAPLPLASGQDGLSGKGLDDSSETPKAAADHGALTEDSLRTHGALTEDSLQEGKGKEGKGKERIKIKNNSAAGSSTVAARPEKPAPDGAVRFDPAGFLIEQGAEPETAADYLTLRNGKRAAATKTALQAIVSESKKSGWTVQQALETCCQRGWAGFKAEWAEGSHARAGPRQTLHEQRKRTLDELTGRNREPEKSEPRDITAEVIRIA